MTVALQTAAARDSDFIAAARAKFAAAPDREEWRAIRALEDAREEAEGRGKRPSSLTVSTLRRELLFACAGQWVDMFPSSSIVPAVVALPAVRQPATFDLESEPGLLGDLARWSIRYAFRPVQEFAQVSALAILAPLFARRFATPTGLGLNLYLIGLAPTGTGKEALIGAPQAALQAASLGFLVGAGDFTSDSAIEVALRARPNFLAPIDEVGEFVGGAQHRMAASHSRTIRKALLDLYGKSRPDGRWTGKQKADAETDKAADPVFAPSLSILGASTGAGFFEALTEANMSDGFMNRLLVVQGGKPGARNLDPTRLDVPAELIDALRNAYEAGQPGNLSPVTARTASARPDMTFVPWAADNAREEWLRVCDWEDNAREAGREGIAGRAAEQTLKVATLRALSRDPAAPAVIAMDVQWAWDMVHASVVAMEKAAMENMGGTEFGTLVNAIRAAVAQGDEDGITRRELLRAKGVRGQPDKLIGDAVKRLEALGEVHAGLWSGKTSGTRPTQRYRLLQPGEVS